MINKKGFTLIEILIVVAIIAILATIVAIGLGPAQQSGRDARRLTDLHEVQNAIELYYQKCGFYPGDDAKAACPAAWSTNTYGGLGGANGALTDSGYLGIQQIASDPSANQTYYYSSFVNGSTYTLGAVLENQNNSVFQGYVAPTNVPAGMPAAGCGKPDFCLTL